MSAFESAAALLALGYFVKKRSSSAPQAFKNGQPINVTLVQIDDAGHLVNSTTAPAFTSMREAAARAGVSLVVNSAFRTMEQQTELWLQYKNGERTDVVAAPGYSNHQAGDAVDFETARGTNTAYGWLLSNAHLFNFYATVPTEPWHWEHRA